MAKASNPSLRPPVRALNVGSYWRTGQTLCDLMLASAKLRVFPLDRITDKTSISDRTRNLTKSELLSARKIGQSIENCAIKFSYLCLPQAIALRSALAAQNIPSRLHFGFLPKSKRTLVKDAELPSELLANKKAMSFLSMLESKSAHAWVSVETSNGSVKLVGGKTANDYVAIASFD